MISIRHFELVKALSEHRHFGRAAQELGISQPALSRSLRQIEDELGVSLFNRTTIRPTEVGRILLRHSSGVLDVVAKAESEISSFRTSGERNFAVAIGSYPAAISGQKAVALLAKLHPDISIDVRVTDWVDAVESVLAEKVHLALADHSAADVNPDLDVVHVRREPLHVFCRRGHPLAAEKTVNFEDLFSYPWVGCTIPLRGDQRPSAKMACGTLDETRQQFRPRIVVETFEAMKLIALNSDALAAGAPSQIAEEVASGALIQLLQFPFAGLNYGFISKHGRSLPAAALSFIDIVKRVEAGDPGL
jgi:DNA-binding transcriptional LysR family regulator